MRRLILIVPVLLFALLVGGCGGSSSTTAGGSSGSSSTTAGGSSSSAGSSSMSPSSSASSSSAGSATSCPTSNTKSFAKTRFATDVGGSLFLVRRYLLQPYQAGKFTKGAKGRTLAIVKAGVAAATTAKLLKNASENAKANPTLCKTVAQPLATLSTSVGDLVSGLKSGTLNPGTIATLTGLVSKVKGGASKAGVPITEQQVPIGG